MQNEEIISKINELIIDEFEVEEDQIDPTANLKETLDIDSLDFVDLVVLIEKNFGFKVKGEELIQIRTLQEFYDFIIQHVNTK